MASSSGFRRRGSDYDMRGSAAQKLAIESLRNIANVSVRDTSTDQKTDDLAVIIDVLRGAGAPLTVAEVADRLRWDSERTANALARGGESGVLTFSRDGEKTTVALAEP